MTAHPAIERFHARTGGPPAGALAVLDVDELRRVCLDCGADDVGFVSLDRDEVAAERAEILRLLPGARSLISFVCRMNRASVQSPMRSVANLEFHHNSDVVNDTAHRIVAWLERRGIRASTCAMAFPMEMDERWPGKTWVISHKPVAVAAGLGQMGIHRSVIHPRFGSFVLLGTVVTEASVAQESRPIEYNPCLECKLCVASCPVGAIRADGTFNFSACYTHNYRELMGGFVDWVEGIADSGSAKAYRRRTSDPETVSMWQSLSFSPNYKSGYCVAVCPAGDDVLAPFVTDRKRYLDDVVRPLQSRVETLYVLPGSDPEVDVPRRFPHKETKRVHSGLHARTIATFVLALPLLFQREPATGLAATYHFTFTGDEPRELTVDIREQRLDVQDGHHGRADLRIRADGETWLRFLRGDANLFWALLTGKLRLSGGSPRLLAAFGRCFPR